MDQTEAQRIALRNALAHQKSADRYGHEVDSEAEALINAASADTAVVAANQGLADLQTITNSWNQEVYQ